MVPPKVVKYKGRLGQFSYNNAEFEVFVKYTPTGVFEILRYKGRETDGTKIRVPDGLVNGSYMFEGKPLIVPPVLPSSLKNTAYMFHNCVSLTVGAVLPNGVKKSGFMYAGCRSLESCPDMPDSVEDAPYMFDGCMSLLESPRLSLSLKNMTGMYRGCRNLQDFPEVPASVIKDDYAYRDCYVLYEKHYASMNSVQTETACVNESDEYLEMPVADDVDDLTYYPDQYVNEYISDEYV